MNKDRVDHLIVDDCIVLLGEILRDFGLYDLALGFHFSHLEKISSIRSELETRNDRVRLADEIGLRIKEQFESDIERDNSALVECWCKIVSNLRFVQDIINELDYAETAHQLGKPLCRYSKSAPMITAKYQASNQDWQNDIPLPYNNRSASDPLLLVTNNPTDSARHSTLGHWKMLACCGLVSSNEASTLSRQVTLGDQIPLSRFPPLMKNKIMEEMIPQMIESSQLWSNKVKSSTIKGRISPIGISTILAESFRSFYQTTLESFAQFNATRYQRDAWGHICTMTADEFLNDFQNWVESYPRLLVKSWLVDGYADEGLLPLTATIPFKALESVCVPPDGVTLDYSPLKLFTGGGSSSSTLLKSNHAQRLDKFLQRLIELAQAEMRMMISALKLDDQNIKLDLCNFCDVFFQRYPRVVTCHLDILVSSLMHWWLKAPSRSTFDSSGISKERSERMLNEWRDLLFS